MSNRNWNWKSFGAGVLCSALVAGLGVPTLAAVAGSMNKNTVNIVANGSTLSRAGENYALQSGVNVPSSISYTDEKGGGTIYLPVRRLSEALGVEIAWDGTSNSVVVGEGAQQVVPTSTPAPKPTPAPMPTPQPTSTPSASTKMYARYPTVPDFGAFAGVVQSDIGEMIGSPGYYYDIIDVDDAITRNSNLLTDYESLLYDCGFSYIGSFEGGNGPVQCYSDGRYSIGVGIVGSRFFGVLILE